MDDERETTGVPADRLHGDRLPGLERGRGEFEYQHVEMCMNTNAL